MVAGGRTGWDLLAVISAAIVLVMGGVYNGLIGQQGGHVAAWFLVGLAAAALLSIYGVPRTAPGRRLALTVSGVVTMVLGLLSILSIGLPILGAGVLAVAAGTRAASTPADQS